MADGQVGYLVFPRLAALKNMTLEQVKDIVQIAAFCISICEGHTKITYYSCAFLSIELG